MKSSNRDRARLVAKKYRKLIGIIRKKIYFTELLIRLDEKYEAKRVKHFFLYSCWTRKTKEELKDKLKALEILVKDSEQFTEELYNKLKAWV